MGIFGSFNFEKIADTISNVAEEVAKVVEAAPSEIREAVSHITEPIVEKATEIGSCLEDTTNSISKVASEACETALQLELLQIICQL